MLNLDEQIKSARSAGDLVEDKIENRNSSFLRNSFPRTASIMVKYVHKKIMDDGTECGSDMTPFDHDGVKCLYCPKCHKKYRTPQ